MKVLVSQFVFFRLVYDLAVADHVPDGIVRWDDPYLWRSRVRIDICHLLQKLEAVDNKTGGTKTVGCICDFEKIYCFQPSSFMH